jgi:hypothetical protein
MISCFGPIMLHMSTNNKPDVKVIFKVKNDIRKRYKNLEFRLLSEIQESFFSTRQEGNAKCRHLQKLTY